MGTACLCASRHLYMQTGLQKICEPYISGWMTVLGVSKGLVERLAPPFVEFLTKHIKQCMIWLIFIKISDVDVLRPPGKDFAQFTLPFQIV